MDPSSTVLKDRSAGPGTSAGHGITMTWFNIASVKKDVYCELVWPLWYKKCFLRIEKQSIPQKFSKPLDHHITRSKIDIEKKKIVVLIK